MLTYTFSTREKVLIAVLGFVIVGILWYRFVFMNIQDQVARIDGQIATTQTELATLQAQSAAASKMQTAIAEYEKDGVKPVILPDYDNTQNLMAYLNGVLGSTENYGITFEDAVKDEEDGTIHRSGKITFGCDAYDEARSIVENIGHGPYPCHIDGFSIADKSVAGVKKNSSKNKNSMVNAVVQVTYFERPTKDTKVKEKDETPEGNDWSVYAKKK